jgi:hypothetical protein
MSEPVTKEHLELLASLAVKYVRDAEQAAEMELFDWACVMAGAGIEAGILAHACVCERELRAADQWRETRKAPFDWRFEDLIRVAVAMRWLPVAASLDGDEPVDTLNGEIGDAVRFVQYARNLTVHPGRHVHDMPWLESLGGDEYTIAYGVARDVFTHLHKALEELGEDVPTQ